MTTRADRERWATAIDLAEREAERRVTLAEERARAAERELAELRARIDPAVEQGLAAIVVEPAPVESLLDEEDLVVLAMDEPELDLGTPPVDTGIGRVVARTGVADWIRTAAAADSPMAQAFRDAAQKEARA